MAAGDYFRFALAYPLKNPKFRNPSLVTMSLDSAYSSGSTLSITDATSPVFPGLINPGDRGIIGPNSDNISEAFVVDSIAYSVALAATVITLRTPTALTYDYAASANVIVKGTRLGSNWDYTGGLAHGLSIQPFTQGSYDRYAQTLRRSTGTPSIRQTLDKDKITPFSYYRLGGRYRVDVDQINGNPRLVANLSDGTRTVGPIQIASSDTFSWTSFSLDTHWFGNNSADGYVDLELSGLGSDGIFAEVDEIFLEHANGLHPKTRIKSFSQSGSFWTINTYNDLETDADFAANDRIAITDGTNYTLGFLVSLSGQSMQVFIDDDQTITAVARDSEIQRRVNGYWQLDDRALRESFEASKSQTGSRMVVNADNSAKIFNSNVDGDRSERWRFGCVFENTSQTIWDNFQFLMRQQERGELINFHPNIPGLPSVMTGKLDIRGFDKSRLWDLNVYTFGMNFEELVI